MKMLEQELTDIWRDSSQDEKKKFETSRLIIELNDRLHSIEETIFSNNRKEIAFAITGILFSEYYFWQASFLLTQLTTALGIIWLGFIICKLTKCPKDHFYTDLAFCVLEQLEHKKYYMFEQAKIAQAAPYWYALFPFMITALFILGLGDLHQFNKLYFSIDTLMISPILKIVVLITSGLFFGIVAWSFKRSLKKEISRIIENIENLIYHLENEF